MSRGMDGWTDDGHSQGELLKNGARGRGGGREEEKEHIFI